MNGYFDFELDLPGALLTQVVNQFDSMADERLTPANISQIPANAQGVYQLLYDGTIVYIGKSDAEAGLHIRLARHALKIIGRKNLVPSKVTFKAIRIAVFAAMDLETQLINYYGRPAWNFSGFGSNDPGRERETTNKNPLGFDSLYPIDIDLPLDFVSPGTYQVSSLLVLLKDKLPYTFRYEVAGRSTGQAYRTRPHADYAATIVIPKSRMSMRQIARLILKSLPSGWQATEFVSHVILYKENRSYTFGTPIT